MLRFIFVLLGVLTLSVFVTSELTCYTCGPENADCYNPSTSANTTSLLQTCTGNSNSIQGFAKELLEKSLENVELAEFLQPTNDDLLIDDFDCYSVVYIGEKHAKGVYRGCARVRAGITACDIVKGEFGSDTVKEGCAQCKANNCNSETHRHNDDGGANNTQLTLSISLFVYLLYCLL